MPEEDRNYSVVIVCACEPSCAHTPALGEGPRKETRGRKERSSFRDDMPCNPAAGAGQGIPTPEPHVLIPPVATVCIRMVLKMEVEAWP
jgi:hypothetical protein